jgi:single-strand DNA-binding protein
MAGSVNKTIILGNLCRDPEIRSFQSGDQVANLSVATSESWKDKTTGERKERTEFHKVVVFNPALIKVCESYLKKGSKVYLEGQLETRSWEQNGEKKYATEIVLRPYRGELTLLDKFEKSDTETGYKSNSQAPLSGGLDDDMDAIPFNYLQDDQIC